MTNLYCELQKPKWLQTANLLHQLFRNLVPLDFGHVPPEHTSRNKEASNGWKWYPHLIPIIIVIRVIWYHVLQKMHLMNPMIQGWVNKFHHYSIGEDLQNLCGAMWTCLEQDLQNQTKAHWYFTQAQVHTALGSDTPCAKYMIAKAHDLLDLMCTWRA